MEKQKAFVLWFPHRVAAGSSRNGVVLEGILEEVDTGEELRFQGAEQLVSMLVNRLSAKSLEKTEA